MTPHGDIGQAAFLVPSAQLFTKQSALCTVLVYPVNPDMNFPEPELPGRVQSQPYGMPQGQNDMSNQPYAATQHGLANN